MHLLPISLRGLRTETSHLSTSKQSSFVSKENYVWLEIKYAKFVPQLVLSRGNLRSFAVERIVETFNTNNMHNIMIFLCL